MGNVYLLSPRVINFTAQRNVYVDSSPSVRLLIVERRCNHIFATTRHHLLQYPSCVVYRRSSTCTSWATVGVNGSRWSRLSALGRLTERHVTISTSKAITCFTESPPDKADTALAYGRYKVQWHDWKPIFLITLLLCFLPMPNPAHHDWQTHLTIQTEWIMVTYFFFFIAMYHAFTHHWC